MDLNVTTINDFNLWSFNVSDNDTNITSDAVNETLIEYNVFDEQWIAIPMKTIFIFLLLCGFSENILVALVIIFNKTMYTTTSFHLFSLTMADLLLITLRLLEFVSQLWCYSVNFATDVCEKHLNLFLVLSIGEMALNTSSLTVTLFTIERYIAICHPFVAVRLLSQKRRVVIMICGVWIFTTAYHTAWYLYSITYEKNFGVWYYIFYFSNGLLFYLAPFITITVLCSLMIYNIKKYKKNVRNTRDETSMDRTFNILGGIVLTFFICWIPYYFVPMVHKYIIKLPYRNTIRSVTADLLYMPAVINPVLYSILSTKFRQAFKDTFVTRVSHKLQTKGMSLNTISHASTNSQLSIVSTSGDNKK